MPGGPQYPLLPSYPGGPLGPCLILSPDLPNLSVSVLSNYVYDYCVPLDEMQPKVVDDLPIHSYLSSLYSPFGCGLDAINHFRLL